MTKTHPVLVSCATGLSLAGLSGPAALTPSWPLVTIADRIVNHAGNLAALRPCPGTLMPASLQQGLPQEDGPWSGPSDTSAHPAFAAAWPTQYHESHVAHAQSVAPRLSSRYRSAVTVPLCSYCLWKVGVNGYQTQKRVGVLPPLAIRSSGTAQRRSLALGPPSDAQQRVCTHKHHSLHPSSVIKSARRGRLALDKTKW